MSDAVCPVLGTGTPGQQEGGTAQHAFILASLRHVSRRRGPGGQPVCGKGKPAQRVDKGPRLASVPRRNWLWKQTGRAPSVLTQQPGATESALPLPTKNINRA